MKDRVAIQKTLRPTHYLKNLDAMKAERAVKRITFDRTEANPGETLYVLVPKLNKNEVIVPGSLALVFNLKVSATQTIFSSRTFRELWWTSFQAPFFKTQLATTFTKSSRIFSFLRMSVKVRFWRAFRAQICARYAPTLVKKNLWCAC